MWSVMAAYPFYLYLRPNKTDSKVKVASVDIGTVGDIPPGTGKNFKFGSTPAIVTHTKDGEFHAFSAICTHLGCTVQFRDDLQEIWCACHGGCYDAATGKNISGPPPKPLTMLKVTVKDDHITVSKA
jgi:Rieske Fe-S protein